MGGQNGDSIAHLNQFHLHEIVDCIFRATTIPRHVETPPFQSNNVRGLNTYIGGLGRPPGNIPAKHGTLVLHLPETSL